MQIPHCLAGILPDCREGRRYNPIYCLSIHKILPPRINNEAKVRQSIQSLVLGKAKVVRFKNIEVARAARVAKDIIKNKGKCGRKRNSATVEVDEPEADEPGPGPEPELAQIIELPKIWRAPVARMI